MQPSRDGSTKTVSLSDEDRNQFKAPEPEVTSDDLRAATAFLGDYNTGAVPEHSHLLYVTQRVGYGERLLTALRRAGFAVTATCNPSRESIDWTGWQADIVLVDAPAGDDRAVDVCRILRKRMPEPIVLLRRPAECDVVLDLAFDTDFYDARSAEFLEVVSCLHGLLRRSTISALPPPASQLEAGELRLDPNSLLMWAGAKAVPLAPREFELMRLLLENTPHFVTKDALMREIWGKGAARDKSIVPVHVTRLRRKLLAIDSPGTIEVVRNVGYRYDPAVTHPQ